MSCENKYQTIDTISDWILKCLKGMKEGTHKENYLKSELYGCCEKFIYEKDIEPCVDSKQNQKYSKKRPQVFAVRLSEKAYEKNEAVLSNLKEEKIEDKTYKILSKSKLVDCHSEHIYPRALLLKTLISLQNPTKEEIEKIISERCKVAFITNEEAELLDKNQSDGTNLRDSMPPNWDAENESVDKRLLARGIGLNPQYFLVCDI